MSDSGSRAVDVVVIGSGAAGLVAAIVAADAGCEVVVLEKADQVGGTTAVSGGVMWIPGNAHMAAAGVDDEGAAVSEYLRHLRSTTSAVAERSAETYIATAPEALAYLEAMTPLRTAVVSGVADYLHHFGAPGTIAEGRSVEPLPYAVGRELPEWRDRLATRGTLMSLGAVTTLAEDLAPKSPELREELRRRMAEDVRTKGAALVAMLLRGVLDRGVEVVLGVPATSLVIVAGCVVGVRTSGPDGPTSIGARRGVVLACGGFEWNPDLVREHIGADVQPLTPANNTGDGLRMALAAGAELDGMDGFWGQPAMFDPTVTRDGVPVAQFEWGRGAPSSIVVDRSGRRFANETLPYHDFAKLLRALEPRERADPDDPPAWLVFDDTVKRSTQLLSVARNAPTPEWIHHADTIDALEARIGLERGALVATVQRYNAHAAEGTDPDFERTRAGMPRPGQVRPLDTPPFYALPMYAGTIGTNGGPRIDLDGRVHRAGGGTIEGLYAAGNTAAAPLGDIYPGAGATIGQAVVFGYRAGRHAAAQAARPLLNP